jgi:CDP-diglyceride synthetase
MPLQDETVASDSPKSRFPGLEGVRGAFSFERDGGLKDRLLTALIVLSVAFALSLVAVKVPYGRLLGVVWTGAVAVMSTFEVVRLFARDPETLRYRPLSGLISFVILALPSLAAIEVAVEGVLGYPMSWQRVYGALLLSGQAMMVYHVLDGRQRLEDAAREGGRYGPAFLLVAISAPQLVLLSSFSNGIQLLWWLVAVVALNDAGAYFVGRSLGRNKMAPALSPNKTMEGSLAGLLIGTGAGVVFWRLLLGNEIGILGLVILSLFATCAAQAADLSKSYLKRLRGVKDTGSFFPGHGGVLDRFDGMIGAAPIVVVALMLWGLS